jgi:hypothetical protein
MDHYIPCEYLVLYGWGGALQQKALSQHKGRYIAFDLGYWNRDGLTERNWRISIDGFHCPKLIIKGEQPSASRFDGANIQVADNHNTKGPILLIGNSPKSQRIVAAGWSQRKMEEIRRQFPGKTILYRPKPDRTIEKDVRHDGLAIGELTDELRRCSLVVTRHSNVAVDACQMGVPVVCEDGAGAAIYPSRLADYKNQPGIDERTEFLQRLAWWQWSINDMTSGDFWPWVEAKLAEIQ